MGKSRWLAALLTALTVAPAAAQNVDITGQVRPRYEYRDPVGGGMDEFTSMRVRLGFEAAVDRNVTVFVQFQDVRLFGEETSTLGDYSADNLDLHQGWIRYRGEKLDWMTTTVGRMETNLGGQRLVGAVGWTQQGRSFDGVRVDLAPSWGTIGLIGYKLGDETAVTVANDAELYGIYSTVRDLGPGALDLYWLYDRVEGAADRNEYTTGGRYAFSGTFDGRVEGSVQTGNRVGQDVSAFMFGARVGRAFADGKGRATLWYDYLSGDDPTTPEVEVFNTLYATNHKFYGFADLFLNLPVHTGGFGLRDAAIKLSYAATSDIRFGIDFHDFSAAEAGTLTDRSFANELDFTLTHSYTSALSATFGFAYVVQKDGLAEIGRLSEDMTWGYVMLNAVF